MMRKSTSMLHCLLVALFLLAMAGCGANNVAGTADSSPKTGALKASLDLPTSKVAQLAVGGIATVEFTVTGSGSNGPLPVVKKSFAASATSGQVDGIYPGTVAVAVYAKDASGNTLLEGFALNATVASGATTDVGAIKMSPVVTKAQDTPCIGCHETTLDKTGQSVVALYKQSGHYTNSNQVPLTSGGTKQPGCAGCHDSSHNNPTPDASGRCGDCHSSVNANHEGNTVYVQDVNGGVRNNCGTCHQPHNPLGPIVGGSCVKCHAVGQNKFNGGVAGLVNDNNGVRAIVPEFGKNSHHVSGRTVTDADCAVCHLEGKVVNGAIAVDTNFHMKDSKIYLRDGGGVTSFASEIGGDKRSTYTGNLKGFVWDPANPDHNLMDQFCFSCHNSNGALSAVGIASGNSATNPFNSGLTNAYDQLKRPAVVAVYDQFSPSNPSHHAVRGKKYQTSKKRIEMTSAENAAFTTYSGNTAVDGVTAANGQWKYPGTKRKTIYEAGRFAAGYSPLGTTTSVRDDSTLHCGDCHTVGQWKAGTVPVVKADGTVDTTASASVAIGAHGSANEYMLRNRLGTDALHNITSNTAGTYVCFICHNLSTYYGSTHFQGNNSCNSGNANSAGMTGYGGGFVASTGPRVPNMVGSSGYGNVFGYTCAHCHNGGTGQQGGSFGAIHGVAATTTYGTYSTNNNTAASAAGEFNIVAKKSYRFMGGLSNKYQGGGSDSRWEATLTANRFEGCYNHDTAETTTPKTLWGYKAGTGTAGVTKTGPQTSTNGVVDEAAENPATSGSAPYVSGSGMTGSWGACSHHKGTSTSGAPTAPARQSTSSGVLQRPLNY
ncbi:cytochrome c3 family protein [Geobacter sp. SVR]|uniref:cytochrome c3 family protein n=1 Tax=Geobacter sp. SVR TaxID=2495594 RepID=UPI00143EF560|nr:cytochrome c3 family protein [Geobacter sp. SVR]BCS52103.1 hypothetical protein GSVR_04110 [Geobacter sp. SVR]GCF86558.1 hypothetical protein GSbR_31580 [Geobacter sp. SVR]